MIVDRTIRLGRDELSEREWRQLFTKLTFFDADRNQVKAYRLTNTGVEIPRGAWNLLPDHVEYEDRRVCPVPKGRLTFRGTLDSSTPDKSFTGQGEALGACLQHEQGIVIRPPGTGKTQIGLALVAAVDTNCIVFVHTEDIFNQWVEYAEKSLGFKPGQVRGEEWQVKQLTIAMVQTVARDMERWRDFASNFGCLIGDEVHHVAAPTWEQIVNSSPSKYRIGFTATDKRADGMHPLMTMLMGAVLQRQKIELKYPTKVIPIKSGFYFPYRGAFDWGELQRVLVDDKERNEKIADAANRQVQKQHSVLVLSRRIEHLENLNKLIPGSEILTGKVPRPQRKRLIADFRSGKLRCLLATQLADEALDVPILDRVILTYPGKHDGRIIQQVGRALREFPSKDDAIIFDIVDDRIGVLRRQWMERKRAYKQMGIPIKGRRQDDEKTPVNQAQHRRLVNDRLKKRMRRGR